MPQPVQLDIRATDRSRAAFASAQRNLAATRTGVQRVNGLLATTSTSVAALGRNLAGSLGVGLGLSGVIELGRGIRTLIGNVDDLGDAAERAGVSGERLQILRYAMEQTAGSAEAADKGLERFAKSIGEIATTGTGPAKDALAALGISIRESSGELKNQGQIFDEVAERFPRLKNEAQATAIAARLFGKEAGPALAVLLRQGGAGLADFEAKLRSLGGVIGDDVLDEADKLDRKFKDLSTSIGTRLKIAAVFFGDATSDILSDMQSLSGGARDLMADPSWQNWLRFGGRVADQAIGAIPGVGVGYRLQQMAGMPSLGDAAEGVAGRAPRDLISGAFDAASEVSPDIDLYTALLQKLGGAIDANIADEDDAAKASGRHRKAVEDLNADLDFEVSLLGKSQVQQRIMTELRRAGVAAMSEEGIGIARKITFLEAEAAAQDRLIERLDDVRDVGRTGLGTLMTDLRAGKGLAASFSDALGRVSDRVFEMASGGLLDKIFGRQGSAGGGFLSAALSLIGGGGGLSAGAMALSGAGLFAEGGVVRGPGSGKSDSIVARLSNGEFVVNAGSARMHRPLLEAINSGMQRFSAGGLVAPGAECGREFGMGEVLQ